MCSHDLYFFAIDSPYYLLILLNSKLVTWWINTEDTPIGSGGAFRHYKYNLQKLSLPKFIPELNNYNLKAIDKVSIYDNIINRYFRLTETEIQFIEDYLADTESCE